MSRAEIAVWGPCGWNFLHAMSVAYPPTPTATERMQMYSFLHAFAKVLPCARCRRHFCSLVQKHLPHSGAPHLATRESLARFLVAAHNMVNERLGHKTMTFEAAMALYGNPDMHTEVPRLHVTQTGPSRAPLVWGATAMIAAGGLLNYARLCRCRTRNRAER
jgi:hypothetical protein